MAQFLDIDGVRALVNGLYKKIWGQGNIQMSCYRDDADIGAGKPSKWTKDTCDIVFSYNDAKCPTYFCTNYIKRKTTND